MVNIDEFFDLYDIFVNELVGNVWLFVIIGTALITYLSIKFKVPYPVLIILNLLWLSIVFAGNGELILWVIVGTVTAALFYYALSKFWKR